MFQLSEKESGNLISHFAISSWGGNRKAPFVFTEQGVAMLSSVLNCDRAIEVNIQIMRAFTKLRELMLSHKDLARQIELLEQQFANKLNEHDKNFIIVFNTIKQLLKDKAVRNKKRGPMGFVVEKSIEQTHR